MILLKQILTTVLGCELVDWINLAQDSNQNGNGHSGYIKVSGWIGGSFFICWQTFGSVADLCCLELLYLV
jgi:hypothetical protein